MFTTLWCRSQNICSEMNGKIHVEIIDLPMQNITVKGTLTSQAQATSLHKGEWFEFISNVQSISRKQLQSCRLMQIKSTMNLLSATFGTFGY